jgi:hypothetical protein
MPDSLRETLAARHLELSLAEERGRQCSSESRHWDLLGLTPPEVMALPVGWPIQLARPFSDRRLQEFLLAVPPPEKYEPHPTAIGDYAGSKQLIRRGLVGILPEQVRTRTEQTHFGAAALERLRQQWPVLESWFGPGGRSRIADRGYTHPTRFWERLQAYRDGRMRMDLLHVDYCLGLEAWLRTLEQPRSRAVTVQSPWSGSLTEVSIDREGLTTTRRGVA